jgi:hypothetical protein
MHIPDFLYNLIILVHKLLGHWPYYVMAALFWEAFHHYKEGHPIWIFYVVLSIFGLIYIKLFVPKRKK